MNVRTSDWQSSSSRAQIRQAAHAEMGSEEPFRDKRPPTDRRGFDLGRWFRDLF